VRAALHRAGAAAGSRFPLNVRVGKYDVPVVLALIFLVLLASAVMNLLTKPTADRGGLGGIHRRVPDAVRGVGAGSTSGGGT